MEPGKLLKVGVATPTQIGGFPPQRIESPPALNLRLCICLSSHLLTPWLPICPVQFLYVPEASGKTAKSYQPNILSNLTRRVLQEEAHRSKE